MPTGSHYFFAQNRRRLGQIKLWIQTQHLYWTTLVPQTVNQRKLYDPRTFPSIPHLSCLSVRRQGPQTALTTTDTAQDDVQPRGTNEVYPLEIGHKHSFR